MPKTLAALSLGVSKQQLYRWENSSPQIAEAVEAAEAEAVGIYLAYVAQAASRGQWQASAWMLERRWPELFGRLIAEHQGVGGGPVQIDLRLSFDGDSRSA
jgi:hypothetical protein